MRGFRGFLRCSEVFRGFQKFSEGRSKSWKNRHLGTDIHDPKARTSTTLRGKNGTIWLCFFFFVSYHLEDTVSRCLVYQDLGHTQTPRICHTFVLSLLLFGSFLAQNACFFMANARLPNRPGFALPQEKPPHLIEIAVLY